MSTEKNDLVTFMTDDGQITEVLRTDLRAKLMTADPRWKIVYTEKDALAQLGDEPPAATPEATPEAIPPKKRKGRK